MRFPKSTRGISALLCWILTVSAFSTPASAWTGEIVSVVDGDTLRATDQKGIEHKIRLYGVDCPEREQPEGHQATAITARLAEKQSVEIEFVRQDRNGRIIATVILSDGLPLQEFLLLYGMAWVDKRYCKSPQCESWKLLESAARISERGI